MRSGSVWYAGQAGAGTGSLVGFWTTHASVNASFQQSFSLFVNSSEVSPSASSSRWYGFSPLSSTVGIMMYEYSKLQIIRAERLEFGTWAY